jgi:hypothetical protein
MENAVIEFKNALSESKEAAGFFYYSGHGVQFEGVNYLIPVSVKIDTESQLKYKAMRADFVLDMMNAAGNKLNVMILDACRDNPFGWTRGASRGLAVTGVQPAGSIIVYATSAGATASDGTGRNGLFTSQFLKHVTTPGLDVTDMFKRTGADVAEASNGKQNPAIYTQFFGTYYLAGAPVTTSQVITAPEPTVESKPLVTTSGPPPVNFSLELQAFGSSWMYAGVALSYLEGHLFSSLLAGFFVVNGAFNVTAELKTHWIPWTNIPLRPYLGAALFYSRDFLLGPSLGLELRPGIPVLESIFFENGLFYRLGRTDFVLTYMFTLGVRLF